MRLSDEQSISRVRRAPFGVLGTVDAVLGAHLVPAVFVTNGTVLVVPIDRIKAKASVPLRRTVNLENDTRATFLVDHRSSDWDDLWWVRLDLAFAGETPPQALWIDQFADKYEQYASPEAIATLLHFEVRSCRGWSATERTL